MNQAVTKIAFLDRRPEFQRPLRPRTFFALEFLHVLESPSVERRYFWVSSRWPCRPKPRDQPFHHGRHHGLHILLHHGRLALQYRRQLLWRRHDEERKEDHTLPRFHEKSVLHLSQMRVSHELCEITTETQNCTHKKQTATPPEDNKVCTPGRGRGPTALSPASSVGCPGSPGAHYKCHRWGVGRFPSSSTCSVFCNSVSAAHRKSPSMRWM